MGGKIPKEYIPAVNAGIVEAMGAGVLAGYPIVDVKVELTDGSYHDVDSSERAFKIAGSMAFKDAMKRAKPILLEPMMAVEVTTPEDYLSVGQIYLLDNPLLREPLTRDHVKPRLLGHWGTTPGPELPVRAPEPRDRGARAVDHLRHRPGPRRPGPGRERLPRRHLLGVLLGHHRGHRGHPPAVPAVLVPGRHPQPRRPRDAGVDPRGRRARLRAEPRLRRRVRQPRPARRDRHRRRRGGDRPAGHQLALEQVRQRRERRRRAADPAPQRVQDREPDRAGAHPRRRARRRSWWATATSRTCSSRASTTSRTRTSTAGSRRCSTRCSTRSRRSSAARTPATSSARSGR